MKKKPVKKSGPSTGGKVVSRVNESDSKNKQVPVTSVTPKLTTAKASQKTMTGARKAVGAIAAAATGVGGVARVAASRAAARSVPPATKKVNAIIRNNNRAASKANKAAQKAKRKAK